MRNPAGTARRLAPAVLVLVCSVLGAHTHADSPLPLTLEDVAAGGRAELAAGATALHVVFFAPWCPPCVDELKRLSLMEDRWAGRGYRIALIAVRNRNTPERLLRFSDQHGAPGTIYLDVSGEAQKGFKADELPTHILIDASGREVGRWASLNDQVEDAVRKLVLSPGGGS